MKLIKIVAIDRIEGGYFFIEETETHYECWSVDTKSNFTKEGGMFDKKCYRAYDHFVGVLGKFDPYLGFLTKPIKVEKSFHGI